MRCVMLHVKLSSRSHAECGAVLPATPVSCVSIELRCVCVCVCFTRVLLYLVGQTNTQLFSNVSRFQHQTQEVLIILAFLPMLVLPPLSYSYRQSIYTVSTKKTGIVFRADLSHFATSPDIGARLFWCAANCLPYLKQNCPCPHHEGLQ